MKCSGIPFTHICECKRCSSASEYSISSSWIYAISTVVVGYASMIYSPLFAAIALGSESDLDFDFKPNATNIDNGKQIIDADPTATIATAHIQTKDPEDS